MLHRGSEEEAKKSSDEAKEGEDEEEEEEDADDEEPPLLLLLLRSREISKAPTARTFLETTVMEEVVGFGAEGEDDEEESRDG